MYLLDQQLQLGQFSVVQLPALYCVTQSPFKNPNRHSKNATIKLIFMAILPLEKIPTQLVTLPHLQLVNNFKEEFLPVVSSLYSTTTTPQKRKLVPNPLVQKKQFCPLPHASSLALDLLTFL